MFFFLFSYLICFTKMNFVPHFLFSHVMFLDNFSNLFFGKMRGDRHFTLFVYRERYTEYYMDVGGACYTSWHCDGN